MEVNVNWVHHLSSWLRRRQRDIDRRTLFPEMWLCDDKNIFWRNVILHVLSDPAWKYRDEWKEEEPTLYEQIVFLDRVLL